LKEENGTLEFLNRLEEIFSLANILYFIGTIFCRNAKEESFEEKTTECQTFAKTQEILHHPSVPFFI